MKRKEKKKVNFPLRAARKKKKKKKKRQKFPRKKKKKKRLAITRHFDEEVEGPLPPQQ